MHSPIMQPMMSASRRRRVLIIESRLLMPGIVSIQYVRSLRLRPTWKVEVLTENAGHPCLDSRECRSLTTEVRTSFICLTATKSSVGDKHGGRVFAYASMSSVIRCALLMWSLSARSESAADDL